MAKRIKPSDLGQAIEKELTIYHESVTERINGITKAAAEKLVQLTKSSAPKMTGAFRRRIAAKMTEKKRLGSETWTWYVKAPDHRLTHLLVHGHDNANGGRTPGDPFLQNALDTVLPEYERDVEEAVKK